MQKYSLDVWTDKCEWERMGLFDTYAAARDEGCELLRCWSGARDFDITPVQVPDKVEEMNPKDINFNVNVEFADSMDQACLVKSTQKVFRLTIQKQNENTKKR